MHEEYYPLNRETERIGTKMIHILDENGVLALDKKILDVIVPKISLELKKEKAPIYTCLFEDSN